MKNEKQKRFNNIALELVHEKGFKGTTMRDLATRMQCDVANLYNYIDSKQSLLEHALFGINDQFHKGIDDIISSGYTPTRKIDELVRLYVTLTSEKPLEVALLVNEWRNLKEEQLQYFIEERARFEEKVSLLIKEGMVEGSFRKFNLKLATYLLLSTLRPLFNHPIKNVNPLKIQREITSFVIAGLYNNHLVGN